ncbi:cytochrome B5 [Geomonas sp.]|uniref:cytochrome B5 n=1 Tax=Geomonas sp. TaxID=2651584 RepID=UPI002B49BE1F|nr:cytochrome B5 [Geomonas sp.]HJV36037.1 cytochrome B5 [Geomonas sp.]
MADKQDFFKQGRGGGNRGVRLSFLLLYVLLALCVLVATPARSFATEQFAKATGKTCSFCHLDPAGGGELTAAGKSYAASLHASPEQAGPSLPAKLGRLAAGYLHFLTAILWFGTILYVHLVLKPAYASQGLPRGEVKVGLLSMAVMGVTGAILTCFRITSLDMLLHTRFGILLMIKVGFYLVMVLSGLVAVLVIGPRLKRKMGAAPVVATGDLTSDELARCDGKEGRPALFAFNNRIYDVTASRLWKQGMHMGRHAAGADLTEALKLAPHGEEKILAMRQVGELLSSGRQEKPLHERVFFFMAYMNLGIVFVIVLILALWRWG